MEQQRQEPQLGFFGSTGKLQGSVNTWTTRMCCL